jgi:hypothetical protein
MYHRPMPPDAPSSGKPGPLPPLAPPPAPAPPAPPARRAPPLVAPPTPSPEGFMSTHAKMSLADIALALRDEQLQAKVVHS